MTRLNAHDKISRKGLLRRQASGPDVASIVKHCGPQAEWADLAPRRSGQQAIDGITHILLMRSECEFVYDQAKVDFNSPHFTNYQHDKTLAELKQTIDLLDIELPLTF